ncbi:MAG TPA: STAS domain-containing protein [Gaiellaceae bacterium]|nr:STAS domain-containing protein [Gaiellaceae bacterium]
MEYLPSVVAVTGELDLSSATKWEEEVEEAVRSSPAVILDLSRVGFVDSAGVRALFTMLRAAQSRGAPMLFAAPRDGSVRRLLEILDLESVVPVCDSVEDALRASRRAGREARPLTFRR